MTDHVSTEEAMTEAELIKLLGYVEGLKKSSDREGIAYCNALRALSQKPMPSIASSGLLNRLALINFMGEITPPGYDPVKRTLLQKKLDELLHHQYDDDKDNTTQMNILSNEIEACGGNAYLVEALQDATVQYPIVPPLPPALMASPQTTSIDTLPSCYQPYTVSFHRDREGIAYFDKLSKLYNPIVAEGGFLSRNYQKPVQLQDIVRPWPNSQFRVFGNGWALIKNGGDGQLLEYRDIVPIAPEAILHRTRCKQLSKTFVYGQYVSFLKIQYLMDSTNDSNSSALQVAEAQYATAFALTGPGYLRQEAATFQQYLHSYQFTNDLPSTDVMKKLIKRGLHIPSSTMLNAFVEAHNQHMHAFVHIVHCTPKYNTWDKTNYRIRLSIDVLLKHALQLRASLEEKIELLRQMARLQALGIQRLQPIFEQIPQRYSAFEQELQFSNRDRLQRATLASFRTAYRRQKSVVLEEKKQRLLQLDPAHEKATESAESNEADSSHIQLAAAPLLPTTEILQYERRRWIFDFGEMELHNLHSLMGLPIAGKPFWPTIPNSIEMINPKVAIQWAFSMFDDPTITRRFSFPSSDACSIDIDFEKMLISISCVREGIKLEESMALDPVFAIPSKTISTTSEITSSNVETANSSTNKSIGEKKSSMGSMALNKTTGSEAPTNTTTVINNNNANKAVRFNRLDDSHLELKLVNDKDYIQLMKDKEHLSKLLKTLDLGTQPISADSIRTAQVDAEQLLPHITKINNVNEHGFNALHLATLHGMDSIVSSILQLFLAKTDNYEHQQQHLRSQKLDLNCTNNAGNTALHLAISSLHANSTQDSKKYHLVNLLLSAGINIGVKNHDNSIAFDLLTDRVDRTNFFTKQSFSLTALAHNSYALWFYLLQVTEVDEDIVGQRVMDYVIRYPALATAKDIQGRVAIDMANPYNRTLINSVFLWHGRYRVVEARPEHQSATCYVYRALDENDKDETGNPRQVDLKLIRWKAHFEREIMARRREFNPDYVVDIIARFPQSDADLASWPDDVSDLVEQAVQRRRQLANKVGQEDGGDSETMDNSVSSSSTGVSSKAEAEQFFCLVMPYASRNMFVALKQERFAGRNMEEVRHIFVQLVNCAAHLHERGVLHADLKSLNMVRMETQWKLIDMDASCIIGRETVGYKTSSAYLPPEAIFVDQSKSEAKVRSCAPQFAHETVEQRGYELLLADPSFDVWSLGCILYQMCNADVRPLFQGGQDDNLSLDPSEDDNLFLLADWSAALKARKLQRVVDPLARNLLSHILQKDPKRRPTLARVLAHPFLSKKHVARMFGDKADYDVFISYRVASDAEHAELLYRQLTQQGLKVWWDKKCLKPGVEWKEGFCAGLVNSRTFVCLLSAEAIFHPNNTWQNFMKLREDSHCDNVFLEHRLALEFSRFHFIEQILPVYIGQKVGVQYNNLLQEINLTETVESLPEHYIRLVEADVNLHLESQAFGKPNEPCKTVKSVMQEITRYPHVCVEGEKEAAFRHVAQRVQSMLHSLDIKEQEELAAETTMPSNNPHTDSLRLELVAAEALLNQLQQQAMQANSNSDKQLPLLSPRAKSSGVLGIHSTLITAKQIELQTMEEELRMLDTQLRTITAENNTMKAQIDRDLL